MQRRDPYQPALEKARYELSCRDPFVAALKSGARPLAADVGAGVELTYWGRDLQVQWASGVVQSASGEPAQTVVQLIVLHYLATADGAPLADRWLSFRELPDGRVYDAAFRRRACLPLVRVFAERPEAFAAAGRRLGGERLSYGDVAFMFQVLPRVRVATILYRGDDEFPAEVNMLFDASLRHYLPIEDVAVLGGMVAGELIRARTQGDG